MSALPTILLVSDCEERVRFSRQILERENRAAVSWASNIPDALRIYYSESPGLLLVDIMLGGDKDGLLFIRKIMEIAPLEVPFIFMTDKKDRNIFQEAKKLRPFGYLIKPFDAVELEYAVELAIEKSGIAARPAGGAANDMPVFLHENIFVRKSNYIRKILMRDVLYIEVAGKYSNIVSSDNKFLIQLPLKDLILRLPEMVFARIHRKYIVNIGNVKGIDILDNYIELDTGITLPMSRDYKKDFLLRYQVMA